MNALKTGIHAETEVLRCENLAEHKELIESYYQHYQPTTPAARFFLDEVIYTEWILRRLRSADGELWEYSHEECYNKDPRFPLGQSFDKNPRAFSRLQYRIDANRRAYRDALASLKEALAGERAERAEQADREAEAAELAPAPAPDPVPATGTIQTTSPANGFVPRTTTIPAPEVAVIVPSPRDPAPPDHLKLT